MKTAVVFYSYDGNCAYVANEIKNRLNADILQLETKDEKRRDGFAKYFWGGSQVAMHKKPALKPYAFEAADYDLIVIGAPVWAASPAPPLQTFLSAAKISEKKLALFLCHAGGKGNAMKKLKAMLPGNTIVAETDFINPAGKGDAKAVIQQIEEWLKRIE
ncbi:MAG: flavodoxin [Treponema sp.]|jgi:flavodoxin|nr:flavodoxin [Treponema sp.]